jgi:LPS sulfotransferase NodH
MRALQFFRAVYWDNELRHGTIRRNLRGDLWLYLKNRALEPLDVLLRRRYARPDIPIVFIVGAPRSGTTVLYQLIADHLDVGFINNRMARYFAAPLVGAMLHGRTGGVHGLPLSSDYGRTDGDSSPHEFSWFWQYHGDFRLHDDLTDDELAQINWRPVKQSLEGLAGYFGRPLVIKNLNSVVYQIEWLKNLLPSDRFIWIQREDRYTVQSILHARQEQCGDRDVWWSVRPRDAREWRDKPAVDQVVHQVSDVCGAISRAFERIPSRDTLKLDYEELMLNPCATLMEVAEFIGADVADETRLQHLVLAPRDERIVDEETWTQIQVALES